MYACVFVCDWVSMCFSCSTLTRSYFLNLVTDTQTWSKFVLVVNPRHRWFKGRPTRWSEDSCRFVQWRPDDDSVSKSRHFMWVLLLYHFFIYRCQYCLYVTCIISCDCLIYLTSMTTPSLTLTDVLYVPKFSVSLLSISQFTKHNNYKITFFFFSLCVSGPVNWEEDWLGTWEKRHVLFERLSDPTVLVADQPNHVLLWH